MAREVITRLIDDIDGSEATETVRFGLDGRSYEVDLNSKNAAALRRSLKPYIDTGRLDVRRAVNGKRSTGTSQRDYSLADLREWAAKNKITLPPRGRIPRSIVEQFKTSTDG